MPKARILIADDDPAILRSLSCLLRFSGYEVIEARDGSTALERSRKESVDLLILDVMMTGYDGFEVCQRVREWSYVPVIVLSAVADEDLKTGMLRCGADDYVVKPFSQKELLARVEAVLRRARWRESASDQPPFVSGDLRVDFRGRRATLGGKDVELTSIEFDVLREFVLKCGQLLTHRVLLQRVWGPEYGDEKEYIRVIVNRLRKKLGDDPMNPRYIQTVPGVGYRFLLGEGEGLSAEGRRLPEAESFIQGASAVPAAA